MNENDNSDSSSSEDSAKICFYCQKENPSNYSFCSYCGHSLMTKICSNCFKKTPVGVVFCPYCGTKIGSKTNELHVNSQPQINNQSPYQGAAPPYYGPPYFAPYLRPREPHWYQLPVFYITFCIFGLLLVSQFVSTIIGYLFGLNLLNPTVKDLIYLDILIKLFQLSLIIIAIKGFNGLKSFFSKQEVEPTDEVDLDIKKKTNRPNILIAVIFVILFLCIILVSNSFVDFIISYIKAFFHITTDTKSGYDFIDSSIQIDFVLIAFWLALFAPIHEEILFRGIFQQALDKSGTSDLSHYLIQGVTFALLHLAGDVLNGGTWDFVAPHMIFTFLFAVLATYLRKKFNSLLPSMVLHSLNNGLSVLSIFITANYFTADQLNLISNLFYVGPIILILVILIVLYVTHQWKISKPLSLKQKNNYKKFIFMVLVIAVVCNFFNYAFILFPRLESQSTFLLISVVASVVVFIIWGKNVNDITWHKIKKVDEVKEEVNL